MFKKEIIFIFKFIIVLNVMLSPGNAFSQADDTALLRLLKKDLGSLSNVWLNKNADNFFFEAFYKENLRDSTMFRQFKMVDGKEVRYDRQLLATLFAPQSVALVREQVGKYEWNESNRAVFSTAPKSEKEDRMQMITVSKPVYIKDGYALLYYRLRTGIGMKVYRNNEGVWQSVIFIPIGII